MLTWPYYDFRDGKLYDEEGVLQFEAMSWESSDAAQQWLEDNDVRGTVR